MKQVSVKIPEQAYERLQHLAHQGKTSYASIIEQALMSYHQTSETSETSDDDLQGLIEAALQPVMARLTALEAMGLVKPLNPEQGIIVSVQSGPQEAHLGGSDGQDISEPGLDEKAAEIGSQAVLSNEVSKPSSSIPSSSKPTVKAFIAELVASGERSPTAIARALNEAGYRAQAGSEFQRSNPQIAGALRGVKA